MAERTEAQRKRADARGRRRGQSDEAPEEPNGGAGERSEEQPLEAVKHAAKVAAAGAAMGAAAAAARALTSRSDGEAKPQPEPKIESKTEAKTEPGPDEAEDEPSAKSEEEAQDDEKPKSGGPPAAEQPEPGDEQQAAGERQRSREEPPGASAEDAQATIQQARGQLETLLGRPVESVSAFERTHDGWLVTLEVVEVSRIPESTDVLASYEMELDDDRNLRRYARVQRYHRSQADRGDQA